MNLCLLPGSGKPLPHPDIAIEEEDDRAFPHRGSGARRDDDRVH
jgi:hypothetical protein